MRSRLASSRPGGRELSAGRLVTGSANVAVMPPRRPDPQRLRAALAEQLEALGQAGQLTPGSAGPGSAGPGSLAAAPQDLDALDDEALGAACAAAVLAALAAGTPLCREAARAAVLYTLGLLAGRVPGKAVEVRVPPYGAVQCVPGPRHTRGTPPNVVECDPASWLRLAAGELSWAQALRGGQVRASGPRADLAAYLPLLIVPA